MDTIHQPPDIAQAHLLAISDERDLQLRRLLAAERRGYRRGREAAYGAGYTDGILARKHLEHDAVEAARVYARRWTVRGEPRTRETFSADHPADFRGRSKERGAA